MTRSIVVSHRDIQWRLRVQPPRDCQPVDVTEIAVIALQESQAYRVLAQEAVHLLHRQGIEFSRLRSRYRQLLQQLRRESARIAEAESGVLLL